MLTACCLPTAAAVLQQSEATYDPISFTPAAGMVRA